MTKLKILNDFVKINELSKLILYFERQMEYGIFIEEFNDDWYSISDYQYLSTDFIKQFQDKVDWTCISSYQILPEWFIFEFQDYVN